MIPTRQKPLERNEKLKFKIPIDSEAWIFEFDKIIEERCDQFDYELEEEGYIIISQELTPAAVSIFNYKVIAFRKEDR